MAPDESLDRGAAADADADAATPAAPTDAGAAAPDGGSPDAAARAEGDGDPPAQAGAAPADAALPPGSLEIAESPAEGDGDEAGAAPAADEPPGEEALPQGRVFLVGAGPGDPGLLTLRGQEVLQRADVVIYDRLVDPALLEHCSPWCERIFAGKEPGRHTLAQPDINRLLVERAAQGRQVVRLKGGDPFVFGRGGEEALALTVTGVPFEVIPGVTSAVAAPAYAGIPVTHRDVAASFAVVTGHERPGRAEAAVDWAAYGRQPDTLVVLMGLGEAPAIAEALIAAGRPAATPVAAIMHGTTPGQRTAVSTLGALAADLAASGLANPTTLVVGEVVRLRAQLQWFERRPLFGRRIVVTRTREQASELVAGLRELGAQPVELPVLQIRDVPNPQDLQWCVTNIASFWWLCFTSAHAVAPFLNALREQGLDARALAGTRIACVGPATARALSAYGLSADVVPARATAADLVEALRDQVYAGQKVLFVRGNPASDTLVVGLTRLGLEVRQTIVYDALPDPDAAASAEELLQSGADALTFASSSTIGHFLDATGDAGRRLCAESKVVCIGPITARAAAAFGLRVDAVADQASVAGMREALVRLWESSPGGGDDA